MISDSRQQFANHMTMQNHQPKITPDQTVPSHPQLP